MSLIHLLAQAAAAASPEAAAQQGVISYPPSFFVQYQAANASEMVRRIPGFSLDFGDNVRGFEGSAGNILIDGQRPASKTDNLDDILRRIPASQVERIDLIRGGAPGIDMQGKTVLANVIRKKTGGTRFLTQFGQTHTDFGQTAGSLRAEASGGAGDRKWEVSATGGKGLDIGFVDGRNTRIYTDGRPIEPYVTDSEGDGLNGSVVGSYETPLLGGKVRLNGRYFRDKFKLESDETLPGTALFESVNDVYRSEDTEIGANFSRDLTRDLGLQLVGLRQSRDRDITSRFTSDSTSSDFFRQGHSTETIGRAVLKYRFSDRLSLEVGGENAINKLDNETQLFSGGAPVDLPAASVEVKEDRREVFAKAAWRPIDHWTVDASLRYEDSQITSNGDVVLAKELRFLKPRLAVAWAPNPSRQIRIRLEREVGQLNFNDFVAQSNFNNATGVTAGNPDIDPQQAWVGEIAFEQRFWSAGSLVLTLRHSELSDVIDRGPIFAASGTFDTPTNIGDGRIDFAQLQYTVPFDRLGVPGLTVKGEVTKRWSEVTDPTTGEKRKITGLSPLRWNGNIIQEVPRWRLTLGVNYDGGFKETYYRFNLVEQFKLRTFIVPYVEWRPAPDINIRAEVLNVTSRGIRSIQTVYPNGRLSPVGVRIEDLERQPGPTFTLRVRKTFGG
jgi:outer membrane receptor protein involved in Fe transport